MSKPLFTSVFFCFGICFSSIVCTNNHPLLYSAEPKMLNLQGDLRVHDPVMIRQGDMYYVFCTGGSINRGDGFIPILCSDDMIHWNRCGHVFETMPEWALQEIPGTQGIWAPDISYFNGEYHIYYSISTFGKNNSAIGLATNKTLDPTSPDYHWDDHGMVLRSTTDVTDWNAIDPNLVLDGDKAWLCWGSFWSGIKMRRIDRISGKPSVEDTTLYSLASRPRSGEPQTPPVVGAIEAPFIIKHAESWYLFVSFDFCCRGKNSTYKIMVGRSENITGPYIDNAGMMMINGGGTLVLAASEGGRWVGPGHCAVVQEPSGDYLVFHAYDSQSERSLSELKISTIDWEDGWPQVGVLP